MAEKMRATNLNGNCRFCGHQLVSNQNGWGCSNYKGGCKAFIWKDDFFFKKLFNRKPTQAEAVKLLLGEIVEIKDVVLKGKKGLMLLSWGEKEGKYPFGYDFSFHENKAY